MSKLNVKINDEKGEIVSEHNIKPLSVLTNARKMAIMIAIGGYIQTRTGLVRPEATKSFVVAAFNLAATRE